MTAKKLDDNANKETSIYEGQPQKTAGIRSPFSQEDLNNIFRISPKYLDRVISRESGNLEFKESFGWKSLPKYLKTCAAFANAKSGYIVFGIGRGPHKLIGIVGNALQAFESIDPQKMTEHFNEHFSPEIGWDIHEYELSGKTYGLLYIYESRDKPVVCTKNADNVLKEGDIYYRYRGRPERVKYPELRAILDLKREKEQRLWMQHLSQISRIGVRDAAIFDLHTGQVTGTKGSFLIDESLLSQLSFIKEGEFSEVKGKPTLKLIGNVEVIGGSPVGIGGPKKTMKIKGIRIGDIVLAFLNHDRVSEPLELIKQICFESTGFLPVYYFMKIGDLDTAQTVELINGVVSRSPSKTKLIERLRNSSSQKLDIPKGDATPAKKKRNSAGKLKQNEVNQNISGKDLEYCLQAMRTLTPDEIKHNSKYLRGILQTWFNKRYSSASPTLADNLRRAICWIDEALYAEGARQPC